MGKGNRIIVFLLSVLIVVSLASCSNKSDKILKVADNNKADVYTRAESYLKDGNTSAAMFYYAAAGDYKDAKARYIALYGRLNSVATNDRFSLGIQPGGTIVAASYWPNSKINVSSYTDLTAVLPSGPDVLGITSSGKVVLISERSEKQFDFSSWEDIVAVSSAAGYHLGVTGSHKLVFAAENENDYKDIMEDTKDWQDIVSVSASEGFAVGLKEDGTVVAAGRNDHKQGDVKGWRDIVAIATGSIHTVGLKEDGTVVATGYERNGQCDVSDWEDIVAIYAYSFYTIGIKKDGTVLTAGTLESDFNHKMLTEVWVWKDVVALSATTNALGVRKDGSILATNHREEMDDWRVQVSGEDSPPAIAKENADKFVPDYKDETEINLIGTIESEGSVDSYIVKQGNWIYYSFTGDGIYKMPVGGSQEQIIKLTSDSAIYKSKGDSHYINVVGDWIYYMQRDQSGSDDIYGNNLIRLRTDGLKKEVVAKRVTNYVVIKDTVYYTSHERLDASTTKAAVRKVAASGGNSEYLFDGYLTGANNQQLSIEDEPDFLYDLKDGSKTALELDGKSFPGRIMCQTPNDVFLLVRGSGYSTGKWYLTDVKTWKGLDIVGGSTTDGAISAYGDWVYYADFDSKGMFRKNMKTGEEQKICNDYNIYGLIVPGDGWVYYKLLSSKEICRIKTDGTGWEKVGYLEPDLPAADNPQ